MNQNKHTVFNQTGAIAIMVAVSLVMLLGFFALAVDVGRSALVINEMQNAADAGALAGAQALYTDNTTININPGANAIAQAAAEDNNADGAAVTITGRNGDRVVERGHWSFATQTFTPNNTKLTNDDLTGVSDEEIDADTGFINAVRVYSAPASPVTHFLGSLLGIDTFETERSAVAWRGFTSGLLPREVDLPIAICEDSIVNSDGDYDCNIGRMINSGNNPGTNDTARWTTLAEQEQGCGGNASNSDLEALVSCSGEINLKEIPQGEGLPTNNGEMSVLDDVRTCFFNRVPLTVWNVTLPVIDCSEGPGCGEMKSAVNVNIVWITGEGEDPHYNEAPTEMDGGETDPWSYADNGTNGKARWDSFVDHYNLQNVVFDPDDDLYAKKSIYFLPECNPDETVGTPGPTRFGLVSPIPKLVQ